MLGARISLVLVATVLAATGVVALHSRADANAGAASAYSETTRYVSNSQFSGDTQGAVTDPDDGDNPSIKA